MNIFKNKVGRPSNKTIKTRKIITLCIVLVVFILTVGIVLFIHNKNQVNNLNAAANSDTAYTETNFKTKSGKEYIYFIGKLGEADAILIESNGNYGLIDTGSKQSNKKKDYVAKFLRDKGIKKLEWMIITHVHSDHAGGVNDIVNTYGINVKKIYAKEYKPEYDDPSDRTSNLARYNKIKNTKKLVLIKEKNAYDIQNKIQLGNFTFNFGNVNNVYQSLEKDISKIGLKNGAFSSKNSICDMASKYKNSNYRCSNNTDSLTLLITHGDKKIYLAGDIANLAIDEYDNGYIGKFGEICTNLTGNEEACNDLFKNKYQNYILKTTKSLISERNSENNVDIYKIAHHGNKSSNPKIVINYLKPKYTVVTRRYDINSVTLTKTLERLNEVGSKIRYYTGSGTTIVELQKDDNSNASDLKIYKLKRLCLNLKCKK